MANLRSLSTGQKLQTGSTKKDIKNPYTILEKVKKGEITSHYKDKGGLFDKVSFYKKADLIKPHMHYIDENRLQNICDTYIKDANNVKEAFESMIKSKAGQSIPQDKKPDLNAFTKKMEENYKKFPAHMKNDIFKMYYHKMNQMEFTERTDKNYAQYKFLERANNPVGKIMSETSNLKSSIFTRNVLQYFLSQMTLLEYIDSDKHDQMMDGLNGDGSNNPGLDQIMKDMLDNQQSKNQMEKAIQQAQDLCKSIDQAMDKPTQEGMFDNAQGGQGAAKLDPGEMKRVADKLARINLSMGSLKENIKKLMDRSKNYFSSKQETKYEDLFNTDNIAGIDDYLFLHPKLRKFMIEDVQVKDTKNIGKINIYIDISGSMSGTCGVKDVNGNNIDKLDFCKAFAYKLQQMDLLNKIFVFNDRVTELNPNIFSIAGIGLNGGTSIDKVLDHISKNDDNALIITDAEDNCSIYSEKAFFIGVEGCRFGSFIAETIAKYADRGQAVMFDGHKIFKVNTKGKVVR